MHRGGASDIQQIGFRGLLHFLGLELRRQRLAVNLANRMRLALNIGDLEGTVAQVHSTHQGIALGYQNDLAILASFDAAYPDEGALSVLNDAIALGRQHFIREQIEFE